MKNKKIITNYEELRHVGHQYKRENKTVVFTNGAFDIIHPGHVLYLEQARSCGDVLIVGINSDESIKQYKSPERPINTLADRITVLTSLSAVDHIVAFSEPTADNVIAALQPHIQVKGGDYTQDTVREASTTKKYGGTVKIIPFVKGHSTTDIIKKIISIYAGKRRLATL